MKWLNNKIYQKGYKKGVEIGKIICQETTINNYTIKDRIISGDGRQAKGRDKEFLDKFYNLCEEYNCAIAFHSGYGQRVVALDPNKKRMIKTEETEKLNNKDYLEVENFIRNL